MQFLRTIFWVLLTVVAVVFALGNWTPVTLNLFGDVRVDVKLPILLLGAFLLGLVPTFLLYRASRWRYRRRLEQTERTLSELRGPPAPAEPSRGAQNEPMPPAAVPSAVPPGVS